MVAPLLCQSYYYNAVPIKIYQKISRDRLKQNYRKYINRFSEYLKRKLPDSIVVIVCLIPGNESIQNQARSQTYILFDQN